jgi:two-component system, chemotaxis family, chemotaxis protein CheY
MARKRVLSIGQCGPDHYSIAWTLRSEFGAEVVPAQDAAEAEMLLAKGEFVLVLVNRVLDSDRSSGMEIVKKLRESPTQSRIPVMLVSNYPDAHQQAVAHGALPGFGKAELGDADVIERLRPLLG